MTARKRTTTRDIDAWSPLRQARKARNATLETICAELDRQALGGDSGVTPGMLSAWERGIHVTSMKYRPILEAFYRQPANELFAHQDHAASMEAPRLLMDHHDLADAMIEVVEGAEHFLAVLGSRSRDSQYLTAIETALAQRPELVHIRVLFGPPRHQVLKDHLLRLLDLRDPHDRSHGLKTLHIGIVDNGPQSPERFFCASECSAVVPIPSLTSAEAFDSGIVLATGLASRYIDHARQVYAGARRVETRGDLAALPIVPSWTPTAHQATT